MYSLPSQKQYLYTFFSVPEPSGECNPGYYCTGGSQTPNQTVTQPGYYSPRGSTQPFACELGTYMPYDRAGECFVCEAGFYCPEKAMTNQTRCPAGECEFEDRLTDKTGWIRGLSDGLSNGAWTIQDKHALSVLSKITQFQCVV